MKNAIIGLLAETSIHPGTEQSTSVIDLPVARERATGYPVIVGSSMKGALRNLARQRLGNESEGEQQINKIFGEQELAGSVMVSDARLLLLPVRSLTGHFKWVTCPYLLERYLRDRQLVGIPSAVNIPRPNHNQAVVAVEQPKLLLEELTFDVEVQDIVAIVDTILPLISHQFVQERLQQQLVILNDNDFKYFTEFALQVNARNVLDQETKASKNLWYEETLPPDSLFYGLLMTRHGSDNPLAQVQAMFTKHPYIQVGGNETVGQGWCAVALIEGGQGDND